MDHDRLVDMYASRWMHDPFGRNQYRWFDGGWTEHVSNGGITSIDPPVEFGRSTDHHSRNRPPSREAGRSQMAESSGQLSGDGCAAMLTAGIAELLIWLAPVAILGGIGVLIVATSTTESETYLGTTTSYDDHKMPFAIFFLALAAAWFFGRGTFRSLGRVFKGRGGFLDAFFVESNLQFALITLGAVVVAVIALFAGLAGG